MTYVALGDSYAAGVGGGPRRGICWRAENGYPVQVARRLGLDLAYNACLGATIPDVLAHQLHPLDPTATFVTITVGGNDIGFVPVLISAAEPGWMSNSDAVIDRALTTLRLHLPGRLDALFAQVRRRAPQARVLVTAYPRLFNGVDCNLATFFSGHEMVRLNQAAEELGAVIAAAARRAQVEYAGVATRFSDHAVCDDAEWVNGVAWPLEGSFHPNAAGHDAYADIVAVALGAHEGAVAGPSQRPVQIVEGTSVPGSAPTFALPDLLSARSLEGARRFGLDPEEIVRLAACIDGSRDVQVAVPDLQAVSAAARLRELDAIARRHRGEDQMDD